MPIMRALPLLFTLSLLFALVLLAVPRSAVADDKKGPPIIKVVVPLGVVPGKPTSIVIFGFKFNDVTEVRFLDQKTAPSVTIKTKGASKAPDKTAPEKMGDSQAELEVTWPSDVAPGMVRFVAISAEGQSEPHQLVVLDPATTIAEKEPNDGFATAQEIAIGHTIVGTLSPGQNVDVFRITGKAGQKVKFEAQAAKLGSALDPFLLLHNAQGQLLAEIDDGPEGADPVLETTLPADGIYYLSVLDANDNYSPLHAYLLSVK
jgi:hypothetical protein